MQSSRWKQLTVSWSLLGYYQRFEALVALALTFLISVIIIVALVRLAMGVVNGLVFSAMDPLDHAVFQTVFGEIMTLLIALEFNHTLQYMVARQQSIVQTSVLLLIAILALARKFILLDLKAVSAAQVLALAGATLALGLTYWFIRARHDADGG